MLLIKWLAIYFHFHSCLIPRKLRKKNWAFQQLMIMALDGHHLSLERSSQSYCCCGIKKINTDKANQTLVKPCAKPSNPKRICPWKQRDCETWATLVKPRWNRVLWTQQHPSELWQALSNTPAVWHLLDTPHKIFTVRLYGLVWFTSFTFTNAGTSIYCRNRRWCWNCHGPQKKWSGGPSIKPDLYHNNSADALQQPSLKANPTKLDMSKPYKPGLQSSNITLVRKDVTLQHGDGSSILIVQQAFFFRTKRTAAKILGWNTWSSLQFL